MNKIVVDLATGTQSIVPLTQAEVDEITNRPPKSQAETDKEASDTAKATLTRLDAKSIRDIRAYIAAKSDAPQALKDLEASAIAERTRVKP